MASDTTSTFGNLSIPVPRNGTPSGDGVVVSAGAVAVDVYIDYQCPFCRQFELMAGPTLNRLVADRMVSLVYHPVNFLDAISPTGYSTRAASDQACSASTPTRFS